MESQSAFLLTPTNFYYHMFPFFQSAAYWNTRCAYPVLESTMNKPNAQSVDLEKSVEVPLDSPVLVPNRLARWNARIEGLAGLEARGIARVPPEERQESSVLGYAQMAMLWFSTNIVANHVAIGFLGPLVFDLGFVDSVMMAMFGALVGAVGTAYMSIWGAQSGNRTMVCFRPFVFYCL